MKKLITLQLLIALLLTGSINGYANSKRHPIDEYRIRITRRHLTKQTSLHRLPASVIGEAKFINENTLLFVFFAPIENAKIEIVKDGIPVFSESYSKLDGSLEIQFSEELEEGDYAIEITNNDGLDLSGNFTI